MSFHTVISQFWLLVVLVENESVIKTTEGFEHDLNSIISWDLKQDHDYGMSKSKLKFDRKQLISSLNRFFSKAHQVPHNLLILLKTITKLLALWMIVPLWVMKWLQCVPNFPFIASRGRRSLWVWKKKTSKVFVSFCLEFFLIALSGTAKELIPKELIISRVNYKFSLSFSRW